MLRTISVPGAIALLLSATTAQAGWYIGAGLGPDTVDFKQNGHVFQPGNFSVIDKTHLSSTGIYATLFGGYGALVHNQWYLAGEVNGNISSTSFRSSNSEYVHSTFSNTKFKINNSVGISVLPGYQYSPGTLFYGRLGYQNGHFRSTTSDVSLANVSKREGGFRYGVGLKQALTPRLAVRMDYSRIDYSDIRFSTFDALSTTTKNTIISPTQQLLEFGLVYSFDGVIAPEK